MLVVLILFFLKKADLFCPCVNRLCWNSEHVSALTVQSSAGLSAKGFLPPGLIKSKTVAQLPGWGFTQREVSLHFFPARFP